MDETIRMETVEERAQLLASAMLNMFDGLSLREAMVAVGMATRAVLATTSKENGFEEPPEGVQAWFLSLLMRGFYPEAAPDDGAQRKV